MADLSSLYHSLAEQRLQLEDPENWFGVSSLVVPALEIHRPPPRLPRRLPPNAPVFGPTSCSACSKCKDQIRGVLCWQGGRALHFGCATEATREAVAAGANPTNPLAKLLKQDSIRSLAETFVAWRRASLSARGRVFQQFVLDCPNLQYPWHLEVSRAFTLSNPELEKRFESAKTDLLGDAPCVQRLYHGTSASAVKDILSAGFKMPSKVGMFGQGLYFADVPHKSWQYAPEGYVLVCDVALGRTERLAESARDLTGAPEGCDSVTGLVRAEGGRLRVPEYVVYNKSQALPRFLLVLRRADGGGVDRDGAAPPAKKARAMPKLPALRLPAAAGQT